MKKEVDYKYGPPGKVFIETCYGLLDFYKPYGDPPISEVEEELYDHVTGLARSEWGGVGGVRVTLHASHVTSVAHGVRGSSARGKCDVHTWSSHTIIPAAYSSEVRCFGCGMC